MRILWLILDHLCTFTAFPEIDHTIAEGGRFAAGRGRERDGEREGDGKGQKTRVGNGEKGNGGKGKGKMGVTG